MDIFKKEYVLRQFEKQVVLKGYASAGYQDVILKLNVQPLGTKEILALPEGIRGMKRLTVIGSVEIHTADDRNGILSDRLFYKGNWYECESSEVWDHTPVGQTNATFVICTKCEEEELTKEPDIEEIRRQMTDREEQATGSKEEKEGAVLNDPE